MLTEIGRRTLPTGCFSAFGILKTTTVKGVFILLSRHRSVVYYKSNVTVDDIISVDHISFKTLKGFMTSIDIRLLLILCLRDGRFPWRPEKH